jgi:hypothetical protein
VRLAYRQPDAVAWFWAAVVGAEQVLVALRAHDIPIPVRGTEIRSDGVWAALICETAGEHWSVGLESFAVALDDPLEAWRGERGDVVPFGLDLEWEAADAPTATADGYDQWCTVHGEVLIGDDRIPVDARGSREHSWGVPQTAPSWRVALPGGPVTHAQMETSVGPDGLPHAAARDDVPIVPRWYSPVAVPGASVVHALCTSADAIGWVSWWR